MAEVDGLGNNSLYFASLQAASSAAVRQQKSEKAKETKKIENKQNNKPPKIPFLKKTTKELVRPKELQKIKIGYLERLKI